MRRGLGFDANAEAVLSAYEKHGISFEDGFPMTPGEKADLMERVALQNQVTDEVLMKLADIPGYGGFYFDHANRGAPTVLITDPKRFTDEALRALPDALTDMVVVESVARSYQELIAAYEEIVSAAKQEPPAAGIEDIIRVSVATTENRLRIGVDKDAAIESVLKAVNAVVDVPFTITISEPDQPLVCTSRTNCYSPLKAGVAVDGSGSRSTLNFGIKNPTDEQLIVVGHHAATTFSHPGLGNIGSVYESLFYDYGFDAKAITASDSQVSNKIFVSSTYTRTVIGSKFPWIGQYLCISGLGTVDCRNVQDNLLTYTITGGKHLTGASVDFYCPAGSSGSPVYEYVASNNNAYAVGVQSSGTGDCEFARIKDVLANLGASLVTSP